MYPRVGEAVRDLQREHAQLRGARAPSLLIAAEPGKIERKLLGGHAVETGEKAVEPRARSSRRSQLVLARGLGVVPVLFYFRCEESCASLLQDSV